MNKTRLHRWLVLAVVLLLGVSLVGPAAASPYTTATTGDDGTTDGGALEEGLTDSSSSDTTSDSDDSTASDSGGDSGESSTSSDSDSDSDSGDDTFLSDSGDGKSSDGGSSSSTSSGDDGSTDGTVAELDDSTADQLPIADRTGMVIDGETIEGTELVSVSSTTEDSYQVELLDLGTSEDAVLELTTGSETTTAVTIVETVDATADEFSAGTSESLDASGDAARTGSVESVDDPSPPVDDTAATEPRASDAGASDDATAPRNAIGLSAPGDLPGEPVGAGAVVGLVGVVAAVVGRQSGAFAGMSGTLGTTARSAAVAAPGSSYLDRLVRMLAPFRYSRYDDSDPLEHEARDAMFDVVESSPGTYLSEIADRAELPLSTARHHIRVLEREGLVSGAKVRGKRRFYPAYTEGVELAAAMNDESTASVIDALARLGASSVSDLAEELDKDPSTVTHHVQRLEEDDVVVRERDGRAVMNKLSAAARTMLEPDEARPEGPTAGEAVASD